MKKIIATVLAMVMALALCTTAFAAQKTVKANLYEPGIKETVYNVSGDTEAKDVYTLRFWKADKDDQNIAYWTVDEFGGNHTYIEVAAKDAEFIVKNVGTKNVYMYLAETDTVYYEYAGAKYTNVGTKCGQFDASDFDKDTKFYTYKDADKNVYLAYATDKGDFTVLVDGEIILVKDVDATSSLLKDVVNGHDWVLDTKAMTAKCSKCNLTGKLYENPAENKDSKLTLELVRDGKDAYYVAYDGTLITNPENKGTTTTNSPKTFDAGVAMYAGMALMSVAGSAVVRGGCARHFAAAPSFFKFFRKKRGSRRFLRYTLS